MKTISFQYMNHNGKSAMRTVDVESVGFVMGPRISYQPGWAITGRCHDKNARRTFYLDRIEFGEEFNELKHYTLLDLKKG